MGQKRNYLLEAVLKTFRSEDPTGKKVLDIGCGNGDYAYHLHQLGFNVLAADMDVERFTYKGRIPFQKCNVTESLPFDDNSFDFIILAEVIEHLRNPYDVVAELKRVLRPGGKLVLSTPNILNLKSRVRFLVEGSWEYFRETPLDQSRNPKEVIWNLHLIPWRYHELEYLLHSSGMKMEVVSGSRKEGWIYSFLIPLIKLQSMMKEGRARRTGYLDFKRINRLMLSRELLFTEHLIFKAVKV